MVRLAELWQTYFLQISREKYIHIYDYFVGAFHHKLF